jgi:hypothetical protein
VTLDISYGWRQLPMVLSPSWDPENILGADYNGISRVCFGI